MDALKDIVKTLSSDHLELVKSKYFTVHKKTASFNHKKFLEDLSQQAAKPEKVMTKSASQLSKTKE